MYLWLEANPRSPQSARRRSGCAFTPGSSTMPAAKGGCRGL